MRWLSKGGTVALGLAVVVMMGATGCGTESQGNAADRPDTATDINTEPTDPVDGRATEEASAEIEMPDVVGDNAAVAKDKLTTLGFTKVDFGSVDDKHNTLGVLNPTNWTVQEQSYDPGEMLAPDTLIVLGCVKN